MIQMRNNKNADAKCCECGCTQNKSLNMFDLRIGGNIFTICDECNMKLFAKTLSADCYKNNRVKSAHDMNVIKQRSIRNGYKGKNISINEAMSV